MWGWGLTSLVYLTPKKKKRLLSFQEADFEEDSDHSQTCSQTLGLSSVPASVHSMQVGALWCLLLPTPPSQERELRGKCLDPSWSCPWGCSVIEPGGHIRLPRQGDFAGDDRGSIGFRNLTSSQDQHLRVLSKTLGEVGADGNVRLGR